jgi:hypothetical protein
MYAPTALKAGSQSMHFVSMYSILILGTQNKWYIHNMSHEQTKKVFDRYAQFAVRDLAVTQIMWVVISLDTLISDIEMVN